MFDQNLTTEDLQDATLFGRTVKKIVRPELKNLIFDHLLQTYNLRLNCTNKYFRSFDQTVDLPTLTKFPHLIYVNTNQPINLIALVTFKGTPHCLYIDKLKGEIYDIKCQFSPSLYTGTIFEGEVVETPQGHLFLISDFLVYMQKDLSMIKLSHRLSLLKSIIVKDHYQSDPLLEPFKVVIKDFIEFAEAECFIRKYINRLVYKSCIYGLVYRPAGVNNKNLIANFPKDMMFQLFQSDANPKKFTSQPQHKEAQALTNLSSMISKTEMKTNYSKSNLQANTSTNTSSYLTSNVKPLTTSPSVPKIINHDKHKEVRFQLFDTGNPDDYILKLINADGQLVQYGYALCNDIKTSLYLQKYLDEASAHDKKTGLCVTCQYYPAFKKWKPVKFVTDQKPQTLAELS